MKHHSGIRALVPVAGFLLVLPLLAIAIRSGMAGEDPTGNPKGQATVPGQQSLHSASIPPDFPSRSTTLYRRFDLGSDVECAVQVYAGTAARWIVEDNPLFPRDSLVRPVSIMAVSTWKDTVISKTHILYWRSLGSDEGLGSSGTVLGSGFSPDPGVPPCSRLELEIRPVETWGRVRTENDLLVSVDLVPEEEHQLAHPKPMVPAKK